jgi:NitT/TauT family transport system substrate-binding protein
MHTNRLKAAAAALVLAAAVAAGCGPVGGEGGGGATGEQGEPITLTVGYQPYYTQSWTGVIMRDKKFYEKYLPKGSKVSFQVGLQGSIIVSQMLAGKQQIGYMGDMPGLVATSKRATRDLRIVSVLGLARDQCNVFLARKGAPTFSDQKKAITWFDGKKVATPQGSCTDRFTQATFEEMGVKPSSYLNQSIEVISTNFENNKIDGATIWEPTATRLHNEGIARRVASGNANDRLDAGFLVMSKELLDKRPDVAEAWLKAELDAQRFLADPKNSNEIAQMAVEQTNGFTKKDMWESLYRRWPEKLGGNPDDTRMNLPFVVDSEVQRLVRNSVVFLYKIKSINTEELPSGAVDDSIARKVLKESGATAPVGEVKALPSSELQGGT